MVILRVCQILILMKAENWTLGRQAEETHTAREIWKAVLYLQRCLDGKVVG
jgi:hypothetical protein